MKNLTQITADIYRLVIPFEDIYTTVFFIRTPGGWVLFDTATYPADMDNYIFPAMGELGITADTLTHTVISHAHRDHAGGLGRLAEAYPGTVILSRSGKLAESYKSVIAPADGDTLAEVLRIVTIPGHAPDALGVYDTRTKTLLTGDCLQAYGIYGSGKWGANISQPLPHLAALNKLRLMEIGTLVTSHDYHPVGHEAHGAEEVACYIDACADALANIRKWILDHPGMNNAALADLYNAETGLPTLGAHVIKAVRGCGGETF